jgi:hypothetical protein
MNKLQLAIDIGRVVAQSRYGQAPDDLQNAAKMIVSALDLGIDVNEDMQFQLGLGWGCADRRKIPLEDATREIL